jgi:hypothetical protein
MDLGRAVTYVTEDEGWQRKFGLGALIMVVPIFNFAGIGYEAAVARAVGRGESRPLPEWSNLGQYFMDGLWLGLAQLVYSLPLLSLLCLPGGLFFGVLVAADSDRRFERALPLAGLVWFCGFALFFAASLLLGFFLLAVTAQFARRGTFSACFDVGAIFGFVRANFSNYLTAWAGQIAVGFLGGLVVGPLATILNFIPCLGWLASAALLGGFSFGMLLVSGHLVGQLLRADLARGTPAFPAVS